MPNGLVNCKAMQFACQLCLANPFASTFQCTSETPILVLTKCCRPLESSSMQPIELRCSTRPWPDSQAATTRAPAQQASPSPGTFPATRRASRGSLRTAGSLKPASSCHRRVLPPRSRHERSSTTACGGPHGACGTHRSNHAGWHIHRASEGPSSPADRIRSLSERGEGAIAVTTVRDIGDRP